MSAIPEPHQRDGEGYIKTKLMIASLKAWDERWESIVPSSLSIMEFSIVFSKYTAICTAFSAFAHVVNFIPHGFLSLSTILHT